MKDNLRMGILENIPMGMLLVPYITLRQAGDYHYAAFLFGIAISGVYAWMVYGYGKIFRANSTSIATSGYGIVDACFDIRSRGGLLLSIVYILRFILKSAFVIYVVGYLVSAGELKLWYAVIIFTVICVYGALGDYNKRRNLANILLWWMLVPIIFLVVFSISRMNYTDIAAAFSSMPFGDDVFKGAWIILAVMSTFELMIFPLSRPGKRGAVWFECVDYLKLVLWVFITVVIAYLYVLGMVGRDYMVKAEGFRISFGTAIDYALAGAWLIGAFYVASSYIFYAKEFLMEIADSSEDTGNRMGRGYILIVALLLAGVIFFVCCIDYDRTGSYIMRYLIYADTVVSMIVPAVIIFGNKILSGGKRR